MNTKLTELLNSFSENNISEERKSVLMPLSNYLKSKLEKGETIRLNFICTHNSRRSHLSQIWAQTVAFHFRIKNIFCYSGGTEATEMFPKIAETLQNQGFEILQLSEGKNPIYAVKYDENEAPMICFSKTYDYFFNPQSQFAAIMTCSSANEACPMVLGAEARFPIEYDDPKAFDGTELQTQMYAERSLQIAQEMWWVFKSLNA
ncbi:low molecular weight phosphatase family protein [Hugenholtzia roseola]|uniref:arsenate-mycothiol transferase ArsC n=1 Tax=Hugenholtzia roseola TaxID=1002 RepID=UPI0003F5AF4B|nr:protein-tyrosine-phosphatase [Hugenholtzia roseola]